MYYKNLLLIRTLRNASCAYYHIILPSKKIEKYKDIRKINLIDDRGYDNQNISKKINYIYTTSIGKSIIYHYTIIDLIIISSCENELITYY